MKNCDPLPAIKTIGCLIGQADLLHREGKLLKAAEIHKRADVILKSALKTAPGNKKLIVMKCKHEQGWNKIINSMAHSIRKG